VYRAVERWELLVYDGTNGDEILAFATPPLVKVSEANGVLVCMVEGYEDDPYTIRTGSVVMRNRLKAQWPTVMSPEEYADRYYQLPDQTSAPEV
jgi:hypothetical protein